MNSTSFTWVDDPLLQKVNASWKELLFQGRYRLDRKFAEHAIRYFYADNNLPEPCIQYASGPLDYLHALMTFGKDNPPVKSKRPYASCWFEETLIRLVRDWEQQIACIVPDFRLADSPEPPNSPRQWKPFPVYRLLGLELEPHLQPWLNAELFEACHALKEACHTVLRHSIDDKKEAALKREAFETWTGKTVRMEEEFRGCKKKMRTEALWQWALDDLRALLPLMPLFDYFRQKKILKDPRFEQLALLFQAGIFSITCLKDRCITCAMPLTVLEEEGHLHAALMPAVGFKDGTQLYFDHGLHYPAEWLRKPEHINLKLSCDNLGSRQYNLLEKLVGKEALIPLLPKQMKASLYLSGKTLKLSVIRRQPPYIVQPVFYLYWEDDGGLITKARRLHGEKARRITSIMNKMKTQAKEPCYDDLPSLVRKLL